MFEDIVYSIVRKGWNVYDAGVTLNQNVYNVVPRGNVTSLYIGRNYLVLPQIEHPRNIFEMKKAFLDMERRNEFPIIHYKQLSFALPAFFVEEKGFTVYSQKKLLFTQEEFRHSLETLTNRLSN